MSDEQMLYAVVVLVVMVGYLLMSYWLYLSNPPKTAAEQAKQHQALLDTVDRVLTHLEKITHDSPNPNDEKVVGMVKQGWEAYKSVNVVPETESK